MTQQGQWKKSQFRDNLSKVLVIIKQEIEITNFKLKERLWIVYSWKVADPSLASYLKELEKQELIEHFDKPEDRRNTWYRIKEDHKQVVDVQISQYQAIQFIEGLNNPFVFTDTRKGKTVSLFIEWENVEKGSPLEKRMGNVVRLISRVLPVNAIPGKFALVVTRDKEGVKP